MSACVCNYGTNDIIGAHDWFEHWLQVIDNMNTQQDITLIHDRMPNPMPTIETCPLCIERNKMGEFLEYGVGRLFVQSFYMIMKQLLLFV